MIRSREWGRRNPWVGANHEVAAVTTTHQIAATISDDVFTQHDVGAAHEVGAMRDFAADAVAAAHEVRRKL